jgi:hypothetical protein
LYFTTRNSIMSIKKLLNNYYIKLKLSCFK